MHDDPAPLGSSGSDGDVDDMPSLGMGGTTAAAGGANLSEPSCIPEGDSEELAGTFAPPDVVWRGTATRGFVDQFLRIAFEKTATPFEARQMIFEESQVRVEQAFVRGGRTYRALVKVYAQSPAVLRP